MPMRVVYSLEPMPESFSRSIFLAGPTPREDDVPSWRPEALRLLEEAGYDGVVFVPEYPTVPFRVTDKQYPDQCHWEAEATEMSDCILFWLPRELATMPGFTTNHEHGEWFRSGKIVFGAPSDAPKIRYLRLKGNELFVPQAETLSEAVQKAIAMVRDGALRSGGERYVPLHVWWTDSFGRWYQFMKDAGNRLDKARVEWTFRVGKSKERVFFWILWADVFITKENRHKTNEVVIGRPDIVSTVLFHPSYNVIESEVVLVTEFRAPVANREGLVSEVSGGSSNQAKDQLTLAGDEVFEETGLKISSSRFEFFDCRQLVATAMSHHAHLYGVRLTDEEISILKKNEKDGTFHGVEADTERTRIKVIKFGQILEENLVDWSTIGMIFQVIVSRFI